MIPRLKLQPSLHADYASFLDKLVKTPFSGEIRADFASRLISSTDNSIYQIIPQAVIFPKSQADLVHLFRLASEDTFKSITFSPRGGGTATNGQSLSQGIIIDCSKYLNRILELNLEQGWVRVQPGVVLEQLNTYLKPHGVFFAPALAPSNRATIGGMINTDACGKGSRIYGRTSNHIVALNWVLPDGSIAQSEAVNLSRLDELKQQDTRLGAIYRQIDEIVTNKRALIEQVFPKIPRFMTGYNLAKVYSPAGDSFNLNWILAGSEGTLAVITEAKLKLTPIPKYKRLLAIHYQSFDDALSSAEVLLKSEPSAIETIDEKILDLAKQDEIYYYVKDFIGEAKSINLVELTESDSNTIEAKTTSIINSIKSLNAQGYYLAKNDQQISLLWELRKKGVGLLANTQSNRKPIPFIEDTAVSPLQLNSYVRELKDLLNKYQLDYAIYGHIDVGCLHLRPALDLKVPEDERILRLLSDEVVSLVKKYGGVMWGEHGKGFRSEYTSLFFGSELYQDLAKIKAVFDPENRLNPGKIVTPLGSDNKVVSLESPLRGHFERQVFPLFHSQYEEIFRCNGNGACFNFHPHELICPSFKATGDRIQSPKGRGALLGEWLRQLSLNLWEEKGDHYLIKLWNTIGKWWGIYDFSHEVYEGMSGCLSCKGCVSQCPVHIDIPYFKAKFLELYYSRYLRPWRDYLIANIELLSYWQSFNPKLVNFLSQNNVIRFLIKHFVGLVEPPILSQLRVEDGLRQRKTPPFAPSDLSQLNTEEKADSVILLQDAFSSFYESQLVLDVYDFLCHLGYKVYVAPFFPSGKPLYIKGFLEQFTSLGKDNTAYLAQLADLGLPMIGIEPSIVLTYRDEYEKLWGLSARGIKVQLLQEFLATQLDKLPRFNTDKSYYLYSHCMEKSLVLGSGKQWQQIFQKMGITLNIMSTGCCGMAGIYGHEKEHYESSAQIYRSGWGVLLPSNPLQQQEVLVTGYSCRCQIQRFSGWLPLHPIQALLLNLTNR